MKGEISGASRWLGHRKPNPDLPWVIDQPDGERWLELGRHATRHEAEVVMARLVSEGRADASSLRVAHRPIPDEGNPLLPVIVFVIGIVVAALVAAVLVLTWH